MVSGWMDDGQMEGDGRDRLWVDGCMNVIFRLVRQAECRDLPKPCFGRINDSVLILHGDALLRGE